MEKEVIEEVEGLMTKARRKLKAARTNFAADELEDAVSRAYYAVYLSANAALLAEGYKPRSHAGTKTLFGLHLVKKGLVEAGYAKDFNRLLAERENGDYEAFAVFEQEEVKLHVETALRFVDRMEQFIKSHHPDVSLEGSGS